jgi:hypothetical protein
VAGLSGVAAGSAPAARGRDSSGTDESRAGRRTMSQATAPAMNVTEMTATQVCFLSPRQSAAGVKMASVRQYTQKPVMNSAKRAPDSNMAESLISAPSGMCMN